MADRQPFVLLDDARSAHAGDGAGDGASERAGEAHIFADPAQMFVARRAAEVIDVLAAADTAREQSGRTLAGYIAYEAGLALEPKLHDLADARSGANGPLVWLGLFDDVHTIAADAVPDWLARQPAPDGGSVSLGPLDPQMSPGAYGEAFAALQARIADGDIYQANLTFPLAGSYRGDPIALYAALRTAAGAGYGGIVFDGWHWLLSLSPELFVSLKDGSIKAKPMKGTRPRSADPAQDGALAAELAASGKDRAENLMIVDLMRNDLSRVAVPGSVAVEAPFAVESYPTVHQMVSTVRARLQSDKSAIDLVRAIFPCGSITGAPKIRAMELIGEVERDARGPYCGAIGRIGPAADGSGSDAAFNVAIRTLRLTPIENGQGDAVLGVGSAIVADSEAMPEWRESLVKGGFARAATPDLAVSGADLIETMRFDAGQGIALLELHLARLRDSASVLGFAFDGHAMRNQIQALCFKLDAPHRIRLLLARSGAIALEAAPCGEPWPEPAVCAVLPLPVDSSDWRLRHKTTDRAFYEDARAIAQHAGAQEALLLRDDGLLTEGSITNVFVERDDVLLTPPAALGLLPGVLRASLLAAGKAREAELRLDDLAGGFLIGNASRGLIPARLPR